MPFCGSTQSNSSVDLMIQYAPDIELFKIFFSFIGVASFSSMTTQLQNHWENQQ